MKNVLAKFSCGAYILAASVVLTIVSFIMAIVSNGYTGYEMGNMYVTVLLSIAVILCGVATLVLTYFFGNKPVISALEVVMVIGLSFLIWSMIYGKMDVFGTVLLSSLEKGYAPAEAASNTGIVTIVLYLVSGIVAIIASFAPLAKKNG